MEKANDTPAHEHDFLSDPMVIGLERCWCGETREAPDVEDCAVAVVAVESRRAA
jgi:hypothetical protein